MPVIVEDGSIVANANSYNSESELAQYAAALGMDEISSLEAPKLTTLLLKGMDFIESKPFKGRRASYAQTLSFPRLEIVTRERGKIASDIVPYEVKKAHLEAAIRAHSQDLFVVEEAQKASVKVDVIETKYFEQKRTQPQFPLIDNLLRPFVAQPSFRVRRA